MVEHTQQYDMYWCGMWRWNSLNSCSVNASTSVWEINCLGYKLNDLCLGEMNSVSAEKCYLYSVLLVHKKGMWSMSKPLNVNQRSLYLFPCCLTWLTASTVIAHYWNGEVLDWESSTTTTGGLCPEDRSTGGGHFLFIAITLLYHPHACWDKRVHGTHI